MDGDSSQACPDAVLDNLGSDVVNRLWGVNGLMLLNSVLMGIVVFIGVFMPRARRNPLISFVLLGASTLFLPIVSNVAATISTDLYVTRHESDGPQVSDANQDPQVIIASCEQSMHILLVLVWTVVVVTTAINISVVIVADAREGRNVKPPAELLIKAIWVMFLTFGNTGNLLETRSQWTVSFAFVVILPYAKIMGRFLHFYIAQRMLIYARNPQLIVGYVVQYLHRKDRIPKLIVWGEEFYYKLVEQPGGFRLDVRKPHVHNNNGDGAGNGDGELLTLDIVWNKPYDTVLKQENKELCFSFALFKLLRCRFAKYTVSKAGFTEAQFFFRQEYLSGKNEYDRVFQVIADELSFINSYYNSSLVSLSIYLIPFTIISISYCLYMFQFISRALHHSGGSEHQVVCRVSCTDQQNSEQYGDTSAAHHGFGNIYFDVVPVFLALAGLLLSEVKDIVYFICSNWLKVFLIHCYIQRTPTPTMKKCIDFVVNRCRSKHMSSWGDKMSQCTILVHRPWWKPNFHLFRVPKCSPILPDGFPLWRLLGFPEENYTDDLSDAKKSVFEAIRKKKLANDREGTVKHILRPSPPVIIPDTEGCTSVAGTILSWHIATSLFELKDKEHPADPERSRKNPLPQSSDPERGTEDNPPTQFPEYDNKVAATRLSRYGAYLVACRPELLPDEDDWCKRLYGDVLKHAHLSLCEAGTGAGFQQMVDSMLKLRAEPDDDASHVLKNGTALAQQLVGDPNKGWKELAEFWSEMILYLAPSENLDGHAEAIARGSEFITFVWALLAHAGIVERLDDTAGDTNNEVAGDALDASGEKAPNTAEYIDMEEHFCHPATSEPQHLAERDQAQSTASGICSQA